MLLALDPIVCVFAGQLIIYAYYSGKFAYMNSDDIRVFLAVARQGRVRLAARELNINQTTVNRRLNALETRLGVSLFTSENGEFVLTHDGQRILDHARRIEEELMTIQATCESSGQLQGHLRLTMADITFEIVAPSLLAYQQQSPELSLDIVLDNWNLDLTGRQVDVAIRAAPAVPKSLFKHHLGLIRWAVYAPLDAEDHVDPKTLPFVAFTEEYTGHPMARWMDAEADNVVFKVNSPAGLLQAVRAGIGASLIPTVLGRRLPEIKQVSEPIPDLDMDGWFLAHRHVMRYPRTTTLLDKVQQAFQ